MALHHNLVVRAEEWIKYTERYSLHMGMLLPPFPPEVTSAVKRSSYKRDERIRRELQQQPMSFKFQSSLWQVVPFNKCIALKQN